MPVKPCIAPGCARPAHWRGRCRVHARRNNKRVRSVNNSFYASKRWRALRRKKILADSFCEYEGCNRLAEHVHHVQPIEDGGDRYAMSNLQSLCAAHHSAVHAAMKEGEGETA